MRDEGSPARCKRPQRCAADEVTLRSQNDQPPALEFRHIQLAGGQPDPVGNVTSSPSIYSQFGLSSFSAAASSSVYFPAGAISRHSDREVHCHIFIRPVAGTSRAGEQSPLASPSMLKVSFPAALLRQHPPSAFLRRATVARIHHPGQPPAGDLAAGCRSRVQTEAGPRMPGCRHSG